ncbi:hypothetical protein NJ76_22560 [Rhodococcus sp. IITR03]|nr:hypothetical protein NJ76_22560 [Rhodococcus sp. IITR03]
MQHVSAGGVRRRTQLHAQHVVPVEDGGDDRPQRGRVQSGGQAQQHRLRVAADAAAAVEHPVRDRR